MASVFYTQDRTFEVSKIDHYNGMIAKMPTPPYPVRQAYLTIHMKQLAQYIWIYAKSFLHE